MAKQPEYGKFRADALEEIVQKGVSRMVHPNTAILLRFKGLTDDSISEKPKKKVATPETASKPKKTSKKA